PIVDGPTGTARFHRWRSLAPQPEGDDHVVTQTLACCRCRGIARRGRVGADPGLGLGHAWRLAWRRLAWWLARRLRLGCAALLCRRTRLWLRLWRLLCAAIGPDPVGTALAPVQPLLLSAARARRSKQFHLSKSPGQPQPGLL